jgi:S-adenosylmethionine:diacylglycerol 3-amino-3-carboxypropyl transferase
MSEQPESYGVAKDAAVASLHCYSLSDEEAAIAFEAIALKAVRAICHCDDDVGFVCRRCRRLSSLGIDRFEHEQDLAWKYGQLIRAARLRK